MKKADYWSARTTNGFAAYSIGKDAGVERNGNGHCGTNYQQGWRDANGGYFMYELKCLPDKPQELYVLLHCPDSGARTFDIQIDGKSIATVERNKPAGEGLYPVSFPIPEELTRRKESITVKFQAKRNNIAGGIFDLRVLAK